MSAVLYGIEKHQLRGADRPPAVFAQGTRACLQFGGLIEVHEPQLAHHVFFAVPEHFLGTDIEGVDQPVQISRDDRHFGRGIEHIAQLPMCGPQLLLALAQLTGALRHTLQGALALADQAVQQGTEHQAQQPAKPQDPAQHDGLIAHTEDLRRANFNQIIPVAEAQQATGVQLIVQAGNGRLVNLLRLFRRTDVKHGHCEVVLLSGTDTHQLRQADDRRDIPSQLRWPFRGEHRRDQQDAVGVGRVQSQQADARRRDNALEQPRTFQRRMADRLGEHIET